MQHEITTSAPLLDEKGNLREPGYAKRLLSIYRRADIKAPVARIKEWDYYLVANDHFAVALTIADNGYMGLDSVSFLQFDEGWQVTAAPCGPFPMGRTGLPETSAAGDTASSGKRHALVFRHVPGGRELTFRMEDFLNRDTIEGHLLLTQEPEESMVICTPFDKPGHFYYNQKINCMRAAGTVRIGGQTYTFDPADSFGVLDWGRGVWTYHSNTWYWGSASGQVDGVPFGWNIGYGFGDTSAASENMLFYDGRAHKLGQVTFHIPMAGSGRTIWPRGALPPMTRVRDGLCTHSGSGCLHGCEAHQIRPASGVRPLHRHGPAGRRHACPGEGLSGLCRKGWRTSGEGD